MTIKDYIASYSSTISEYWYEIKLFIYALFVSININIDVVKILMLLMFIDTILGSIKAIFVEKYNFDFKILLWGIISKCTILLIPMILALVALGLGYNFTIMTDVVLKILIVSESLSSITNILSIKERKPIKNTDFVSSMLHAIRFFLIKKLEVFIKNINNKE